MARTKDFEYFKTLNDSENFLSPFELKRFHSYRQASDAQNFFIARYLLRQQLKTRLNCEAQLIEIQISPLGKPYLASKHKSPYHFSIAHCSGFVLVAIAKYQIGVDIERIDRISKPRVKVKKLINEYVGNIISKLDDNRVQHAAMQYWTGLEAYVKLKGSTLASERGAFAINTNFPLAVWDNCSFVFGRFDFAIWSVAKNGSCVKMKLTEVGYDIQS